MKKIALLSILSFCICSVSFSQINKGSVLLGGGINATSSKSGEGSAETKNWWFSLTPSIGFAVKENKVVGINLLYSHQKYPYSYSPLAYRTSNGYGGGVFYRSYLPLAKRFYLFGEANALFRYYKQNAEPSPDTKQITKQTELGLNLYPGLTYAIGKRFHLEASINNLLSLSYNKNSDEFINPFSTTKTKGSNVNFSANVSTASPLTLGFRFVLGK